MPEGLGLAPISPLPPTCRGAQALEELKEFVLMAKGEWNSLRAKKKKDEIDNYRRRPNTSKQHGWFQYSKNSAGLIEVVQLPSNGKSLLPLLSNYGEGSAVAGKRLEVTIHPYGQYSKDTEATIAPDANLIKNERWLFGELYTRRAQREGRTSDHFVHKCQDGTLKVVKENNSSIKLFVYLTSTPEVKFSLRKAAIYGFSSGSRRVRSSPQMAFV